MIKTFFLLTLLLFIHCKNLEVNSINLKEGVLIKNTNIISSDSDGAIIQYAGHVVIDKDLIVYSGKEKPKVTGNYQTVDGKDKYTIPGLIDSHLHLLNMAGFNWKLQKKYPELVNEYYDQLPKSYLYFGYTTVIDADNYDPRLMNKLKAMEITPDIYSCGAKTNVMDNFEMEMAELPRKTRLQLPFLHDKYNKHVTFPDSIDLEKHSAEYLVKKVAEGRNICVKTLYEDPSNGLKKTWENASKEIMREVVDEAHKNGMPVMMHAPSYEAQLFAKDVGIDIMAHSMWNWTSNPIEYFNTDLPQTHKDLLKEIAAKGIGYQPTTRAVLAEIDILNDMYRKDSTLKYVYPKNYLDWLQTEEARWIKKRILRRPKYLSTVNPEFFYPIRNQYDSNEEMTSAGYKSIEKKIKTVIKFLSDHNANLLFSTDTGAMNMYTSVPGYNGFLEMNHWVEAGIELDKIFKAATYNNAKAFGLLESLGTIETGKRANLLVLETNPLESVDAYNQIEKVIIGGQLKDRKAFVAK